ncbi:hypothetical protein PQX77_006189 [Marasmius sp. AFHP31]|nr:hypothetical protein PQX77_006189 [Marasmius sp. AFHP31]
MVQIGVLSILSITILSLECVILGLVLFPLPRLAWRYVHHFAFTSEGETIQKVRSRLKIFLIGCTSYALFASIESLIRIIYCAIRFSGYGSGLAHVDFFIAGPTFLVSLVLPRTLYIVLTHLNLQKQLKEANGNTVQEQPTDLSCEWLYKPRTMKDIKDGIYDTVRSSLGQVSLDDDAESGSAPRYRDEVIARQEKEIADLRRALASHGFASAENTTAPVPGPSTMPQSTGGFAEDLKV